MSNDRTLKKEYKIEYNYSNKINGRKRSKTKDIYNYKLYDNGDRDINVSTSTTDIDRRNGFIFQLFKVSLIFIFGGYFFSNGVNGFNNSQVLATANTKMITNTINDVEYFYRVHSVDYDYTTKLNQLYGLRNVFDLSPLEKDPAFLVEPTDSMFRTGGQFDEYYDLYYELVLKDSDINEEIMYIDYRTIEIKGVEYTYSLFVLNQIIDDEQVNAFYNQYAYFLDNFVNWTNANEYSDYLKGIEPFFYDVVYAFKVLNAPIIWAGNLAYDIGVIINFITNW